MVFLQLLSGGISEVMGAMYVNRTKEMEDLFFFVT